MLRSSYRLDRVALEIVIKHMNDRPKKKAFEHIMDAFDAIKRGYWMDDEINLTMDNTLAWETGTGILKVYRRVCGVSLTFLTRMRNFEGDTIIYLEGSWCDPFNRTWIARLVRWINGGTQRFFM